eukprot:jgi/Bigna1/83480/fgenesh1_pg.109_\
MVRRTGYEGHHCKNQLDICHQSLDGLSAYLDSPPTPPSFVNRAGGTGWEESERENDSKGFFVSRNLKGNAGGTPFYSVKEELEQEKEDMISAVPFNLLSETHGCRVIGCSSYENGHPPQHALGSEKEGGGGRGGLRKPNKEEEKGEDKIEHQTTTNKKTTGNIIHQLPLNETFGWFVWPEGEPDQPKVVKLGWLLNSC